MKKIILFLLILASFSLNAGWDKTFGGEGNDFGHSIKQTEDGGFVIAGATASFGSIDPKSTKGWLMKLDSNGELEWGAIIGENDMKSGLLTLDLNHDEDIIVGGFRQVRLGESPVDRKWLMKYDYSGTKLWDSVYSEKIVGSINAIDCTPDFGYLIGGMGETTIAKTNEYGTIEFGEKFGWLIYDILPTNDGGYIFIGENDRIPSGYTYITTPYLTKIGSDYSVKWENPFGKEDMGILRSAKELPDGSIITIGDKIEKKEDHIQIGRMIVTKYNEFGNVVWEHKGEDFSNGFDLELFENDIYVIGNVSDNNSSPDYYIARLGQDGAVKWDTTFGGEGYDYPSEFVVDKKGNLIIVGQTDSKGAGRYDLNVFKIDLNSDPSSISENEDSALEIYNYPNPAENTTTVMIRGGVLDASNIEMKIFSSDGRIVGEYSGFEASSGIYSKNIDTQTFSNGLYFYKVMLVEKEFMGMMIIKK